MKYRNVSLCAFRAGSVYIMDLGITRNSGLDYLPRYRNKNGRGELKIVPLDAPRRYIESSFKGPMIKANGLDPRAKRSLLPVR